MTKEEILKEINQCHSYLNGVLVSGDNAILVGESLKILRKVAYFVKEGISKETEIEKGEEGKNENAEVKKD